MAGSTRTRMPDGVIRLSMGRRLGKIRVVSMPMDRDGEEAVMKVFALALLPLKGIIAAIAVIGLLLLFLFGVAMFFVGLTILLPVARAYLGEGRTGALRERMTGARQTRSQALLPIACGPVVGLFLGFLVWLGIRADPSEAPRIPGLLLLMVGVGTLAGLVTAGAMRTAASVLGKVRKTVNERKRSGVWDADLDSMA